VAAAPRVSVAPSPAGAPPAFRHAPFFAHTYQRMIVVCFPSVTHATVALLGAALSLPFRRPQSTCTRPSTPRPFPVYEMTSPPCTTIIVDRLTMVLRDSAGGVSWARQSEIQLSFVTSQPGSNIFRTSKVLCTRIVLVLNNTITIV